MVRPHEYSLLIGAGPHACPLMLAALCAGRRYLRWTTCTPRHLGHQGQELPLAHRTARAAEALMPTIAAAVGRLPPVMAWPAGRPWGGGGWRCSGRAG